jgi:hypothetical protein
LRKNDEDTLNEWIRKIFEDSVAKKKISGQCLKKKTVQGTDKEYHKLQKKNRKETF